MKPHQVEDIIIHLEWVLKPAGGQDDLKSNRELLFHLDSVGLISLLFPVPEPSPLPCFSM